MQFEVAGPRAWDSVNFSIGRLGIETSSRDVQRHVLIVNDVAVDARTRDLNDIGSWRGARLSERIAGGKREGQCEHQAYLSGKGRKEMLAQAREDDAETDADRQQEAGKSREAMIGSGMWRLCLRWQAEREA
jgi:hypothetical protein